MNSDQRDHVLRTLAEMIGRERTSILDANAADVAAFPADDVLIDRLKIDDKKIDGMIRSINNVLAEDDLVGSLISSEVRDDGLRIENRRVPFGTILIIFEARPDVCIEAAIIALKAGNRILLKGGKEARRTNLALAAIWTKALEQNGVDPSFVSYLDITRDETQKLISGEGEHFDLVIPRGGEQLIDFAVRNSKAPVLVSGRGNNFLYIDAEADTSMATLIALNGKSRLSVCNALDKILIARDLPDIKGLITDLRREFERFGIAVIGDDAVNQIDPAIEPIDSESVWYEEFLAAKVMFAIADGVSDAVAKINEYSGGHSASIVTNSEMTADRFMHDVDCAAVYHNASTRFTDGGEFGLGAEIAISTQKLHARGPLGARHLLTNKWYIRGDGQIRA